MMGNAMYRKQVKKYQSWTGYPDSPVLSGDYPYQSLIWAGGFIRLYCSSAPIKMDAGNDAFQSDETVVDGHYLLWQYNLSGATWVYNTDGWLGMWITIIDQANHDVCEQDGTTVYFAKTTTTEQDGGTTASLIRNLHHKDGASVVRDKAAFWLEKSASGYQQWTGYPDSPVLLAEYPYQCIIDWGATKKALVVADRKLNWYYDQLYTYSGNPLETMKYYTILNSGVGEWSYTGVGALSGITFRQANNDVYTDNTISIVRFSKTTTPSQDAGVSETLHRINI